MFMRLVYDEKLAQAAYVIGCQRTGEAIVIDPERDVDRYIELAREHRLRIVAVAETHIHADFVSGARELAEGLGAMVYVSGEGGAEWRSDWVHDKPGGGSYAHRVLRDGDAFHIGGIEFKAVHTPGHTPEHLIYLVTDRGGGADAPIGMATGDFVFVGDLGRPDLLESAAGRAGEMEPSARRLFQTIKKLDGVPDFVQVWPGHGAGSACGKALGAVPMSTVGYERRFNATLREATDERRFVDFILRGQPEPPMYFAEMKRVNKVGPRVLGLAEGIALPRRMDVEELRRVAGAREAVLVDTRAWEAFRAGHVPGSLCLPLDKQFNTNAGSFIRADEPMVLIIEPARLEEAVRDLLRIGLDELVGWVDAAELAGYADERHALARLEDISAEEAATRIERGEARVLDVRRATEYADAHIDGAVNIAHTRLASRMDEVPRDQPLIVHCQGGVRSVRAAAYLQRQGLTVANMRGGFEAWEKALRHQASGTGHQ